MDRVSGLLDNMISNSGLSDRYVLCNDELLSIDLSTVDAGTILWDNGSMEEKQIFEIIRKSGLSKTINISFVESRNGKLFIFAQESKSYANY